MTVYINGEVSDDIRRRVHTTGQAAMGMTAGPVRTMHTAYTLLDKLHYVTRCPFGLCGQRSSLPAASILDPPTNTFSSSADPALIHGGTVL